MSNEAYKLNHHIVLLRDEYVKLNVKYSALQEKCSHYSTKNDEDHSDFVVRILKAVRSLYNNPNYSDIDVIFKGNIVLKCHKFILNARNLKINNLDIANEVKLELLEIPRVLGEKVFKWIYTNELDLSHENYHETLNIIKFCNFLNLNSLKEKCQYHVIPFVNKDNCIEIYEKSVEFKAQDLQNHAYKIVSNYWDDYSYKDFGKIPASLLYELIKSHSKHVLYDAIKFRREDVVLLFLIEQNARIPHILNQINPDTGELPLNLALRTHQASIAQTLVKYNANLNACDAKGFPLLHNAILRKDQTSCDFLLDAHADPNVKNPNNRQNALHLLANLLAISTELNSNHPSTFNAIVQNPINEISTSLEKLQTTTPQDEIDKFDNDEFYIPLGSSDSAIYNDIDSPNLVEESLNHNLGSYYNNETLPPDKENCYPQEIDFDIENLIMRLIALKTDIYAIDIDGKTPLQLAIENGSKAIFDLLLDGETSITRENSPLIHCSADNLSSSLTEQLLNLRDKAGHTLLYVALAQCCNIKGNTQLSANNLNGDNNDMNLNYDIGCADDTKNGFENFYMANRLISKGIPYTDVINPVTGLPLINELLLDGNEPAVKYLIQLPGVNVNCHDNNGTRPIHIISALLKYLNLARLILQQQTILTSPPRSPVFTNKTDSDEKLATASLNSPMLSAHILDINALTQDRGQSPLHIAINERNWSFLDLILDHYSSAETYCKNQPALDINIRDFNDETPLSLALAQLNYDVATKLIFHGANINIKFSNGTTLLERCMLNGEENQAIFLLENGANLLKSSLSGNYNNNDNIDAETRPLSPDLYLTDCGPLLELAIRKGLIGVVKALCQLGIDLNCELGKNSMDSKLLENNDNHNNVVDANLIDFNGGGDNNYNISMQAKVENLEKEVSEPQAEEDEICPLWLSLSLKRFDIASILVQHGCDTTFWCPGPDGCQQTLLHKAIDLNREDIACFLVRSNCEVNSVRKPGPNGSGGEESRDLQTPLHLSCAWGLVKLVFCLLEHKADVNITDADHKTPMHIAIENHHPAIINELLAHPFINLTIKDKRGKTAFETAMSLKNHKAAQLIVDREPSASEQIDAKGYNFLHTSIKKRDIENVLFLLGIKANVNSRVQDFMQNTPLHIAASESTEIILRNLILAGSDVNAKNTNSQTPLHMAVISDNADFARILVENGADYNALDNNGNNALHLALINGHVNCIEYLLSETDIAIDTINFKGRNALHLLGMHVKDNGVTIFEMFKKYRPQSLPINTIDSEGNTPLLIAYLNGRGNLCRSLVKGGASLGTANQEGVSIFNAHVASHQLLFRLLDMLTEEPTWTESDFCNECNTKFTITMRKHHCRHCGRVLCTKCSDKMLPIPKFNLLKPVRVCGVCFDVLTAQDHSNAIT